MRIGQMGVLALGYCIGTLEFVRSAEPERHEFTSRHMGIEFRIVMYAPDRSSAEKASVAAFARIAVLDNVMSDYNVKSELMRLCLANDKEPGKPFPVSADLFAVLEASQAVSLVSDGAFDVTVGPLVRLWRIARRTQILPDAKELAEAKAKVGYAKLKLDAKSKTVTFALPGMRLDLGGIGKGFAADEALIVLRKLGIMRALVAASGDIRCGEAPPGKAGWDVDIAPIAKGREPRRLTLANAAVSTSGDLFQFVVIGGVRYSHVLDPKTGLGLTGRRSVTVIAPTSSQADSLTKAASVLPPAKALALIDSIPGAATYIVVKTTDNAPENVTVSKEFEKVSGGSRH